MNAPEPKPTRALILTLAALALLLLAGCAYSATPAPPGAEVVREAQRGMYLDFTGGEPAATAVATGNLAPLGERMIIRSADLALLVEDTQAAVSQIRNLADSLEG